METFTSEDFILSTIIIAKREFGEKERYVSPTRLNKLITLVYNELNSNDVKVDNFIWGYYRYGFFSKTVMDILGQDVGLYNMNLNNIPLLDELNVSEEIIDLIVESVKDLKNKFIQKSENFYKMIYVDLTPEKYSNFYLTHRSLIKWFDNMEGLSSGQVQTDLYGKKDMNISDIISNYYSSINHLNDLYVLDNFIKFTDILELLSITLNNNGNVSRIAIKFDLLRSIYEKYIFPILVPYKETLTGDKEKVLEEKKRYTNIVQNSLFNLNILEKIYLECDNEGLLPDVNDIKNEIFILTERDPNSRPLQDIYAEIEYQYSQ